MSVETQASVVLSSVNWTGKEITTIQYIVPRSILAEINTHRVFSRNVRNSSRAIPTTKVIEEIRNNPFIPEFKANQRGMVAKDSYVKSHSRAIDVWLATMRESLNGAEILAELDSHKQYQNRLLEPFSYVKGVITSTEWENFYSQRISVDAEPEMCRLAESILECATNTDVTELRPGEWHLPFIQDDEKQLNIEVQKKISVARCARISVVPFDSATRDVEKDLELYNFLLSQNHWSPFEHIARVPTHFEAIGEAFKGLRQLLTNHQTKLRYGNFSGWFQYRQEVQNGY